MGTKIELPRRRGSEVAVAGGGREVFAAGVSLRWSDHPVHVVDFEGSLSSGVLEYGVATVLGNRIVDTTTRLCGATGRIRREDEAVHGLSDRAIGGAEPFSREFERFSGLRATGPMAAHFAPVENGLIKAVWPYPRTSPDFARPGGRVTDWGPWVDTGRLYPQLYPSLATARLEDLVRAFGLQERLDEESGRHCPPARRRYHAALYDALAAALLLARLADEPGVGDRSLGWLLTMSTLDPAKREALNQGELFGGP